MRVVDPAREILDRVEDDGAAGVLQQVRGRSRVLDDGAPRREVASQDRHAAALLQRVRPAADDGLSRDLLGVVGDRADRAARDRDGVEGQVLPQLPQKPGNAPGPVKMLHVVRARRLEVDQDRDLAADAVELIEIDP
jgi:hypothetical protein